MQKLTLLNGNNNPIRRTAKFNIGQEVFVIEWRQTTPHVLVAYVLFIGIEHPNQPDDFIYLLNRNINPEEKTKYYEKEVFASKMDAIKFMQKLMRKNLAIFKEMKKQSYWKNSQS